MEYSGHRKRRLIGGTIGALSMLMVGIAAVPAHAESARSQQWHLDAMQAEKMWKVSKGKGITVAVIDTGVKPTLPDLQGQVLPGKDFTDLPGGAHDDYKGHGTGMAALIAGTGKAGAERGTFGLAPESKILPLRIDADPTNASNAAEGDEQFVKSLAPAIRYAAGSEAQILNISMANRDSFPAVNKAIRYALSKGKLIFAGVGNDGDDHNLVMYPAATPGVVGVAAVDREVKATDASQHGPQVDLAAPGDEMTAACIEQSGFCKSSGTSDATAIASASAALIWAEHPDWTANQVTRVLVNTAGGADNGKERSDYIGYGAVRPRIALLEDPGDPGDPKTNPLPGPYYEGNASASPKPSEKAGESDAQDRAAAEPAASQHDGGLSTGEWIAYGLAAAALLAGAVAVAIVATRRRTAASATPAGPYPGQQPVPPMPPGAPPTDWYNSPHRTGDHRHN